MSYILYSYVVVFYGRLSLKPVTLPWSEAWNFVFLFLLIVLKSFCQFHNLLLIMSCTFLVAVKFGKSFVKFPLYVS